MTKVIMPKMGDGMEEGTLLEWLKKDGDKVRSGEVIGNIQTDKATLELESPGSGILTGFLIKPGETVPVGVPIAAILKAGETLAPDWATASPSSESAQAEEAPTEVQQAAPVAQTESSAPQAAGSDRVKASPLARKIAAELGVDLTTVTGTGPGGRIVEKDVRSGKPSGPQPSAPVSTPAAAQGDTKVPLNRLRQIIAQRTTQSKQQVPHFYVTVEVDIEAINALRDQFEAEESGKVSINDFVIKACARALADMPEANASFGEKEVVRYGQINIGVAAAVEEGLLVPTIKNVERLSLREIGEQSRSLVKKARDGKLLPDEMQGSTFSVSNMGMLNVDNFIAIINQPNAAIVAIASAKKVVVANEDEELEVRTRMNITGSFDHRVLDGALGAKFMNIVRDYLQNPTRLLA